jgi:hypothetical protein
MNENTKPADIIQTLPKYINALLSDSVLFFSGENAVATEARKQILLQEIAIIKAQITALETFIG